MGLPTDELNSIFAPSSPDGLPKDVLGELESIMRLHSISPQELFYKWESYSLKMGSEDTRLDLDTVRLFKKDVQDALERDSRARTHVRSADKRNAVGATPRSVASNSDVFGMLDDLVPNTPHNRAANGANGSAGKRKNDFQTPSVSKVSRPETNGTPGNFKTPHKTSNGTPDHLRGVPFSERTNSGEVLQSLNDHLPAPEAPIAPFPEPRIKIIANTDLKKFAYKPMAMRLSESSEVLDERIDEFMAIVQKHHNLEDSAFGNPTSQSTSEIVAVGRIASDSLEGKLNKASLVLETSRRMGAGRRVPLKIESLATYQFFPGQIVAVRGVNPSGDWFTVSEVLTVPLLPTAASTPRVLEGINERLGVSSDSDGQPLKFLISSGPYTADDNLDFEPLRALCDKAAEEMIDALILTGPFLDIEHPLLSTGDFDLPDVKGIDENSTLSTLFRFWITAPLQRLASAVPSISIILVPSVRDIVSKHVSWPQDSVPKKELGLPKQVRMATNPVTLSLNETVVGITSHDVLYELRNQEVVGGKSTEMLARLPRHMIEQRHFFPLFPPTARENLPKPATESSLATGAMLDVGYLKLGEWWNVRPDVLITPSMLPPFIKVIESVLVINPGTLSKKKAAGTFAQLVLHPRLVKDEERDDPSLNHKVFERAKVEVVKI